MMNVKRLRTLLDEYIREKGDRDHRADTALIIMHTLKLDKTALLMGDREVSEKEEREIRALAERLAAGEPIQYIIGACEFMSLPFYLEKGVLIPRADTEALIDAVIKRLDKEKPISLIDMCCGSGCIGVSLAYYMKNIDLSLCDFSDIALGVTKKNAERLISGRKYKIFKMDLMKDFPTEEFDCVVSNPPYIRSEVIETLDKKVRCFEPLSALDGGEDGLIFYRRIAENARIKKGGYLAFETGFDQGQQVAAILDNNNYREIEIIKDIENRDRVVLGRVQL